MENSQNSENVFSLTASAAQRIKFLRVRENKENMRFRVLVKGGGCSGFQYEFSLDDTPPAASDIVIENSGAEVVIDDISLGLVSGGVLDYTEDLAHAGFEIKNPNASAKCGCGNSFSVSL